MELKLNDKYMLTIKEAAAYYGIGINFYVDAQKTRKASFRLSVVICG